MIRSLLIILIKAYQTAFSPVFGQNCRYYPSCSEYMIGCIARHGAFRGLWLGCRRIFRCHPIYPGGYDPVP